MDYVCFGDAVSFDTRFIPSLKYLLLQSLELTITSKL
jgi:hypothetical protein